eukprot:gene7747-922_t
MRMSRQLNSRPTIAARPTVSRAHAVSCYAWQIQHQFTVNKPIEQVYNHFADPRTSVPICDDVKSVQLLTPRKAPTDVGATFRIMAGVEFFGILVGGMQDNKVLTARKDPYSIVHSVRTISGDGVQKYEMSADGEGTAVTYTYYTVDVDPAEIFSRCQKALLKQSDFNSTLAESTFSQQVFTRLGWLSKEEKVKPAFEKAAVANLETQKVYLNTL